MSVLSKALEFLGKDIDKAMVLALKTGNEDLHAAIMGIKWHYITVESEVSGRWNDGKEVVRAKHTGN